MADLLLLSTGSPLTSTLPPDGSSSPRMTRSRVVLPAPLGPMIPVNSPLRSEKVTSLSTWREPRRTPMSSSVSRSGCVACGAATRCTASFVKTDLTGTHSSQVLGRDLVRYRLAQVLHLGQHPSLVVVPGGRHRLIHADHRDVVLVGQRNQRLGKRIGDLLVVKKHLHLMVGEQRLLRGHVLR